MGGTISYWGGGCSFPRWRSRDPVSNFDYLGRNDQPHITAEITVSLAGVAYLLGEWGLMAQRWWRLVPAVPLILHSLSTSKKSEGGGRR